MVSVLHLPDTRVYAVVVVIAKSSRYGTVTVRSGTMWVSAVVALVCLGITTASPTLLSDSDKSLNPVDAAESFGNIAVLREKRTPRQHWVQLLTTYDSDDDEDTKPRRKSGNVGGLPLLFPFQLPAAGSRSNISPVLVLPVAIDVDVPETTERKEIDVRFGQRNAKKNEARKQERRHEDDDESPTLVSLPPPRKSRPRTDSNNQYPSYIRVAQLDETATNPSISQAKVSSKELVEMFQAQAPQAPQLPPALLSNYDISERVPHPEESRSLEEEPLPNPTRNLASRNGFQTTQNFFTSSFGTSIRSRDPPRPRFDRSLILHGALTVPRADYTETYTAWYDGKSGAARVDFHGGSTSTYRTMMADGSLQRLEMRVDRSGEGQVRRCGKAVSQQITQADRAVPALPDLDQFSFSGYEQIEGVRAERWQRNVLVRAGDRGATPGETLTIKHTMLLMREREDIARPLRYTVKVDSSVLGADCDGYEHNYFMVQEQNQDTDFFTPNIDNLCDFVQPLNTSSAEHLARLEPLREFTLPERDPRYDDLFKRFKIEYNRQYADNTEEAVRKTVLIHHVRFIRSGNREGATFELATNFLSDRLDGELRELRGVTAEAERSRAEQFPHSKKSLDSEETTLPDRFDWRPRGAVSPVRFQGKCSSCWAFAVAGAVEGAMFVRTRRLVPLSEKCLVDCAHPFGGNGCKGTWPSHAYDYVQNRGLPALEEYTPYRDMLDTCVEKTVSPVTRISGHVNVTANSVTALKVAIKQHSPSVVIVDAKAKSFVFYKKGVLYDDRCSKGPKKLNHAVLAVGWSQRKGEPHFILKNSWSEKWGERGYVRVHARSNTCGVLAKPSYPRLEDDDVIRAPGDRTRVRPRETDY